MWVDVRKYGVDVSRCVNGCAREGVVVDMAVDVKVRGWGPL